MDWRTVAGSATEESLDVAVMLLPVYFLGYAAVSSEVFAPLIRPGAFPRWLVGKREDPRRGQLAIGIPIVIFAFLALVGLCISIAIDERLPPVARVAMGLGVVGFVAWTLWVAVAVWDWRRARR